MPAELAQITAEAHFARPRFTLDVAFTALAGVTVLFGPSGAGKSTTLDLIAGHLRPQRGRITLSGAVLFDAAQGVDVPPHRRRIGYVMQAPALFPHLNVARNLAYGLSHLPRQERQARVDTLAERLGLARLLARSPRDLSGGEQQRVALGRALAPEPQALLLDEPLSALDAPSRQDLLALLREVVQTLSIPVLYVTHDQKEAAQLGTQLVRYSVMEGSEGVSLRGRLDHGAFP
jgi:molybdate transport system ATP-binding protein